MLKRFKGIGGAMQRTAWWPISLSKPSEPRVGKDVSWAIGRPARRIHLTMWPHNDLVSAGFAAALP